VTGSRLFGAFRIGSADRHHSGMIAKIRRMPVSITVLLLAAALGACNHSGGTAAAGATTKPAGAPTTTATAAATAAGGGGDFCAAVKQQKATLQGTELSSLLTGGTPAAWKAYLAKTAAMNQQLDDAAPAEIKPSVDVLQKESADLRAAMEAAGYDVRKLGAAKLLSLLNTPERKEASTKLTDYVKTNCKIDLSQA
jgi:hypothetical protein